MSDDIIRIQINAFGEFLNNKLTDTLKNANKNDIIDKNQRWKVLDTLNKEYINDPLIYNLNKYKLNTIIQREQEIRGHGKIQATPDTLLGDVQFVINIRTSLFPHYFSHGIMNSKINDINSKIDQITEKIFDYLHDIDLGVPVFILTIKVSESLKKEVVNILKTKHGAEVEQYDKEYIIHEPYEDVQRYIIVSSEENVILNDLLFYKNWQTTVCLNKVNKYGLNMVDSSYNISQKVENFKVKDTKPKTIDDIANFRKELIGIENMYLDFFEMIKTVDSFRNYQLQNFLVTVLDFRNKHQQYDHIICKVFLKEYEHERSLLERISSAAEIFINRIKGQLLTTESIYQSLYNNRLQVFLKRLEIIGIVFAIFSIGIDIIAIIISCMCGGM